MATLDSFPFDRTSPRFRHRTQSVLQPLENSFGNEPVYAGSFHKTLDMKDSPYYRGLKNGYLKNTGEGIWYDAGGPFWSESSVLSAPSGYVDETFQLGGITNQWKGHVFPQDSFYRFSRDLAHSDLSTFSLAKGLEYNDLCALGATGIARSIPNIPEISVFDILGELREGLATVPGKQLVKRLNALDFKLKPQLGPEFLKALLQGGGSEYLNLAFGVMPTLSDVEGMTIAANGDYRRLREKLNADMAHVYHRRRTLKNDVTVENYVAEGVYCYPPPTIYFADPGRLDFRVTTTQKVWFSGSFSHSSWSPTLNAQFDEFLRGLEDYGVLPNAQRIWQLVPWSWLVDWFTNTGSLLTNISYLNHGGLRLLYGYVMAETTTRYDCTWTGNVGNPRRTFTTTQNLTSTVKQRWMASPYGFGLKFDGLTVGQKAVLVALGLTRTKLLRSGKMT